MRRPWVFLLVVDLATSDCVTGNQPELELGPCDVDLDCIVRFGQWAPFCHGGICSQCDADQDCADGFECADNIDGFGTCIGAAE